MLLNLMLLFWFSMVLFVLISRAAMHRPFRSFGYCFWIDSLVLGFLHTMRQIKISSAKSKSSRRDVNVHCMPVGLLHAVLLNQSVTRRKRTGQSCFTPVVTKNGSVIVPPWRIWHVDPSHSCCMMGMILCGIPWCLRISQSA
jgi:hypothetical protein